MMRNRTSKLNFLSTILATKDKLVAMAKTEVTLAQNRVFMEDAKYKSKQAYYKEEALLDFRVASEIKKIKKKYL